MERSLIQPPRPWGTTFPCMEKEQGQTTMVHVELPKKTPTHHDSCHCSLRLGTGYCPDIKTPAWHRRKAISLTRMAYKHQTVLFPFPVLNSLCKQGTHNPFLAISPCLRVTIKHQWRVNIQCFAVWGRFTLNKHPDIHSWASQSSFVWKFSHTISGTISFGHSWEYQENDPLCFGVCCLAQVIDRTGG